MQRLQEYPVNPISGHAYSIDGYNWTFSPIQPYSNAVHRTDGTVQHFATLERPKLLWGDADDPFREYRAGSSNGIAPALASILVRRRTRKTPCLPVFMCLNFAMPQGRLR